MSWRTALGAFIGLLLPVPLVLILGGVMHTALWAPSTTGPRVSPVLGYEERMRLRTYRRDCHDSSDCEPPLGCLMDARAGVQYCVDSQCLTDSQCPDRQVCQKLATYKGSLVRRCIPLGVRKEGEMCVKVPGDQNEACEPGLLCGGDDGWCARPCRKQEPASCPEGFFCADVQPEPVCLPTCETRGCPDGTQCIHYEQGTSQCARTVYGPQCQETPCPEGRECMVRNATQFPDRVWMECVETCDKDRPACSAGLVCDGWHCLRPCDPKQPGSCGEGYRCDQHNARRPWACKPDW